MKPILYHKILKLVEQDQLQSITIDVFDTVLLFNSWPDSLRTSKLAKDWASRFRKFISEDVTDYEVYDWYRFTGQLLKDSDQPIRSDLQIETTVRLLCNKYHAKIDNNQKFEFLASLITDELSFMVDNTKINRSLIAQLSVIKQLAPKVKIYCSSNSRLTCDQVRTLMQINDIEIFDDGACTSDFDFPCPTFLDRANKLSKNFMPSANLHISASHEEYRAAIESGSMAYHYRPIRMRGLRTLIGQTIDSCTNQSAHHRERLKTTTFPTSELDHIIRQATDLWHCQILTQLDLCKDTAFLLPATDATLDSRDNLTQAPDLDQDTILRAFIWLLANHDSYRWDAASLLKLLIKSAGISNRLALYQLCYDSSYITSEFIINSREEDAFWSSFLSEIRNNSSENIELLRQSYITAAKYLPRDDKKLQFINLSHDHSAWLYREFARLHDLNNEIIDWRPAGLPHNITNIPSEDREGNLLAHTELAPDKYFHKILQPRLNKLMKH